MVTISTREPAEVQGQGSENPDASEAVVVKSVNASNSDPVDINIVDDGDGTSQENAKSSLILPFPSTNPSSLPCYEGTPSTSITVGMSRTTTSTEATRDEDEGLERKYVVRLHLTAENTMDPPIIQTSLPIIV